jgi:hypothetical protein
MPILLKNKLFSKAKPCILFTHLNIMYMNNFSVNLLWSPGGSYHWICSQNSNLFTSYRKTVLEFVVSHRKVPVTFWLLPSLDSTQL